MNVARFITSLSPWVLFFIILSIGLLTSELGVWIGHRKLRYLPKSKDSQIGSMVGAMLGLLAFMLGITFSITSSRFASRKEMVVQQAKAITTCYLRTSLIPEKQRDETRLLFRKYIDLLVHTKDPEDLGEAIAVLNDLNMQIWNQSASLVHEEMDSELRSLYIESVNDVLDTFNKRKTVALVYKIPSATWVVLILLFVLSTFVVGYETGDQKRRRILNTPIMSAAFALIVTLIADMDSAAYSKNFRASQRPLIEAQEMISQGKSL
jgi:hypothetical protein